MTQRLDIDGWKRAAASTPDAGKAPAAATTAERGDFILVVHRGETRLAPQEVAELQHWIQTWLHIDQPCHLLMGCCADTAREDRVCRLRDLVDQITECGVPREWVRYTDEWVAPAWRPEAAGLPEDVVWLKVLDAHASGDGIRTIRSMFDDTRMEAACTAGS